VGACDLSFQQQRAGALVRMWNQLGGGDVTPWAAAVASSSADGHGGCWTGPVCWLEGQHFSPTFSDRRGARQLIFFQK